MRLPRSVTIEGKRWRVVRKPLFRRGLVGLCVHRKREIWICTAVPRSELREVFLHEVMHACLPEPFARRTEEAMVTRLAARLVRVLPRLRWER